MRYLKYLLLPLILTVAVVFAQDPAAKTEAVVDKAKGTPHAKLEETEYDAGRILSGTDVVHTFKIKNTGDADLIIKEIKPG